MKANLPAHEVSFVRLRKRMNILASNSPVAIFYSTFWEKVEREILNLLTTSAFATTARTQIIKNSRCNRSRN